MAPIHLATNNGSVKIVRKLLINGADKDVKNNLGQTSLDLAK